MRLSVEQIASGFRVDQCALKRAIDEKVVQLDTAGTVSLMLAQALSRFVSDEFEDMFGSEATFFGSQLVYSEAIRFSSDKIAQAVGASWVRRTLASLQVEESCSK